MSQTTLHVTWTDPETGLTWTSRDLGKDMDWSMATYVCKNM